MEVGAFNVAFTIEKYICISMLWCYYKLLMEKGAIGGVALYIQTNRKNTIICEINGSNQFDTNIII